MQRSHNSSQGVEEPCDLDVLCGRGGLSNHHYGNAWYRELIRSNRQIYKTCPKHTKLMVAKAIVQSVTQQGGRFLEKKGDGLWYEISKKRALDKTSQGLRERDRDGSSRRGTPSSGVTGGNSETASAASSSNNNDRPRGEGDEEETGDDSYHTAESRGSTEGNEERYPPFPSEQQASGDGLLAQSRSTFPEQQGENTSPQYGREDEQGKADSGRVDWERSKQQQGPLAQGMDLQLEHANDEGQLSAEAEKKEPEQKVQRKLAPDETQSCFEPLPLSAPGISDVMTDRHPTTLTRVKSQVSDWLTGFFPVNDGGNPPPQHPPAPPRRTMEEDESSYKTKSSTKARALAKFHNDVAHRIITVAPTAIAAPPTINTIPPMMVNASRQPRPQPPHQQQQQREQHSRMTATGGQHHQGDASHQQHHSLHPYLHHQQQQQHAFAAFQGSRPFPYSSFAPQHARHYPEQVPSSPQRRADHNLAVGSRRNRASLLDDDAQNHEGNRQHRRSEDEQKPRGRFLG